jgi:hypothetical protein
MNQIGWRDLAVEAVQEARKGSPEKLELLGRLLEEADLAKQALRDKGYGWTGLSMLETIRNEVPAAARAAPDWPPRYDTKSEGNGGRDA